MTIYQSPGIYDKGHCEKDAGKIDNLVAGYAAKGFMELKYAQKIHCSSKSSYPSINSTADDLYKFGNAGYGGKYYLKRPGNRSLPSTEPIGDMAGQIESPEYASLGMGKKLKALNLPEGKVWITFHL